jgi:hypothetical protein
VETTKPPHKLHKPKVNELMNEAGLEISNANRLISARRQKPEIYTRERPNINQSYKSAQRSTT